MEAFSLSGSCIRESVSDVTYGTQSVSQELLVERKVLEHGKVEDAKFQNVLGFPFLFPRTQAAFPASGPLRRLACVQCQTFLCNVGSDSSRRKSIMFWLYWSVSINFKNNLNSLDGFPVLLWTSLMILKVMWYAWPPFRRNTPMNVQIYEPWAAETARWTLHVCRSVDVRSAPFFRDDPNIWVLKIVQLIGGWLYDVSPIKWKGSLEYR